MNSEAITDGPQAFMTPMLLTMTMLSVNWTASLSCRKANEHYHMTATLMYQIPKLHCGGIWWYAAAAGMLGVLYTEVFRNFTDRQHATVRQGWGPWA